MILFFIVATLLLLLVLALVLQPLLRRFDDRTKGREDNSVGELGRNRLAELKQKLQNGEISEAEYVEQVRDLETQIADDMRSGEAAAETPPRSGGRWAALVVLVFVPVLSGVLYLALGEPEALLTGTGQPEQPPGAQTQPADIDAMAARLAQRLKDNPDDAEGWFMLGRSYMVLQRYSEAADAFEQLRALTGDSPDVLVNEATALAMSQGGSLAGEPSRLIEQALDRQPDHAQALWMAATAAYQRSDYRTALGYYRSAEPMLDGEPLQQVRGMIEELTARSGAAEQTLAPEPAPASLRVNVSLSPALKNQADPGDTVFIFAKAVEGPPMPLAVAKATVADLPVSVTLDDSQAMMPRLKLSGYERVTVGARVSGSGQAAPEAGDLEGESRPVATGTPTVIEIVIDRVVDSGG